MAPASLPSLRIFAPPLLLLLSSSLHVDGGAFVTKRGGGVGVSGCRNQDNGLVAAAAVTSNVGGRSSLFRLPWKSSSSSSSLHSTSSSSVTASAETFSSLCSSRPSFAKKFRSCGGGGGGCGGFTPGRGGGQSGSSNVILRSTEVDNDVVASTAATETATSDGTTNGVAQSSQQDSFTKGKTKILYEDNQFLKPLPDRRAYRSISLPNGLIVLLASDPQTDVESGAVHVKAGHFNDPKDRAGLAHFHEHMLFLGTEKYPQENEYEAFLSRNGGSSNAYTDMEDTNYYFSVAALGNDEEEGPVDSDTSVNGNGGGGTSPALSGALDRFAQFFIAPTFRTDMVEREMRAINSEYLNGMTSDAWRSYQLLKDGSNVDHPFHKFGCGNYQTLTNGGTIINSTLTAEQTGGTSPRHELLKFWKDNYHPSNMRLCVVGRASLDELQKTVEETFGNVNPKSFTPLKTKEECPDTTNNINGNEQPKMFPTEHATHSGISAFPPKHLSLIREVIPLMESRVIKIHFAGPPMSDPTMKESRVYRVLSHLLGHESPGSLHSVLNDLGYISGLSSGVGIDVSDFSLLSMTITLTPHGYQNRDHVLSLLFQYISLLKSLVTNTNEQQHNLMEQYHNELKQMSNVNFQFRENGDPTDFCSSAAGLLFDYEPNLILGGSTLTGEYNGTVAKALLDRMIPENSLIVVSSPDLDKEDKGGEGKKCRTSAAEGGEWMEEKWYRAKYRQIPISNELIKEWSNPETVDSRLKLPKLNEFIPRDFSLRCDDDEDTNVASDTTDPKEEAEDTIINNNADRVQPPNLLLSTPKLRLWHKMDTKWRVPKTSLMLHISSPNVYFSPRTMTLNRIYQRVLNDDLNEFVYDASVAGCNYRVSCVPTGLRVSVSGYSEKLPSLLDTVTTRMLTLIHDLKEGPNAHPTLAQRFQKAKHNLLRETKNYKLDSPYEIASYNSRLLMEEKVWHLDSYVAEMEEEVGREEKDDDGLSMEECGKVVEECLTGRVKAEALCIGNINESEAQNVADVIDRHFLQPSRPLSEDETPTFRSMKLPTKDEAIELFGPDIATKSIPIVLEDVAYSPSEENSAVEVILQAGCEHDLGYEGVALLELIGNMAYSSAFNQLRTKEQLGYLVSAFTRKTAGGAISLAIIVQSSAVPLPSKLEERIEAWLHTFRSELENMSEERIVMEAEALVAQFLERDVRLSEEIGRVWGEILATETLCERLKEPVFDRHVKLADAITVISSPSSESDDDFVNDDNNPKKEKEGNSSLKKKRGKTPAELKRQIIHFFDEHFASNAPKRRAMSARVYSSKVKDIYEGNKGKPGVLSSYDDVRNLKQYLSSWPLVPYWKKKEF